MALLSKPDIEYLRKQWDTPETSYIPVEDVLSLLVNCQELIEQEMALVSLVSQCIGSLEQLAPEIAQVKLKRLRELGYGEEKL